MRHVAISSAALMLAGWSLALAAPPRTPAPAAADAPANKAAQKLVTAARAALAAVKSTTYEHTTDIDEAAGRYVCDCSGFVVYLLKKHLPEAYKLVPKDAGKARPTAENFHALFASLPAKPAAGALWTRVDRLADARPGDVITWRHNDPKPGATGHVMVIDGAPQREGSQFRLRVIDSARSPHANDSRATGQGGLGRGEIFVTVDAEGRATAYRWAKPDGDARSESIMIGRLVSK